MVPTRKSRRRQAVIRPPQRSARLVTLRLSPPFHRRRRDPVLGVDFPAKYSLSEMFCESSVTFFLHFQCFGPSVHTLFITEQTKKQAVSRLLFPFIPCRGRRPRRPAPPQGYLHLPCSPVVGAIHESPAVPRFTACSRSHAPAASPRRSSAAPRSPPRPGQSPAAHTARAGP